MTTGAGSRFPLTRLAAKYHAMQRNGVHLSNKRSIEIIRRRIEQLAGRIDQNEAPDRLENLGKLWKKYKKQKGKQDPDQHITAKLIDEEFEKAYHDYAAWEQMMEALKLDSDLVGAEVKIAKDLHAILTAEDAYELVAQIFGVIIAIEQDPNKLKRYQYELTRLVGDGSIVEVEESD